VIEIPRSQPAGESSDPLLVKNDVFGAGGLMHLDASRTCIHLRPWSRRDRLAPGSARLWRPGHCPSGSGRRAARSAHGRRADAFDPSLGRNCGALLARGVNETGVEGLEEIARQFLLPGGYIRQAATLAIAQAGLENRVMIRTEDVVLQAAPSTAAARQTWPTGSMEAEAGTPDRRTSTLNKRASSSRRAATASDARTTGPASTAAPTAGYAPCSRVERHRKTLAARILAAELGMDSTGWTWLR